MLVARDFVRVVDAIAQAKQRGRAVVVMLGGHVVKTGLAPLLIDLMQRGIITHLAMNGSAAIHDYEIARFGGTSEDVAAGLRDGTFGMAEETGRGIERRVHSGDAERRGMGEAIAARWRLDGARPSRAVGRSRRPSAWVAGDACTPR